MHIRLHSALLPIGFCLPIVLAGCGDPPSSAPDTPLGSLRVVALDTVSIDSIRIDLDDVRLGQFRNPHLLRNIVAGIHKIMVSSTLGATTSRTVEVVRDRQTDLLVQLLTIGPYVGSAAPVFTARTIAGDTMSIEKLRGKAVFLAFFEHT